MVDLVTERLGTVSDMHESQESCNSVGNCWIKCTRSGVIGLTMKSSACSCEEIDCT